MPQDANPQNTSHNTQSNGPKPEHKRSSVFTPGQVKQAQDIPVASGAEHAPGWAMKEQAPRKKRLSFGGGNDGRGSPMFANLESVRGRHMADGYNDQKPPDGFIGAAFKRFINSRAGATVSGGK